MRFNLLDLLLPRETKFYTYLEEEAEQLIISLKKNLKRLKQQKHPGSLIQRPLLKTGMVLNQKLKNQKFRTKI